MKIFLTGATGFVGGSLARELIGRGHELTALARPSSDRSRLADLSLSWVEGDITRPETLSGRLAGHEWVIHAAGRLGAFGISQAAYHELHVNGTRNLLAEAVRAGAGRILYVSSPGVLGPTRDQPKDETADYGPTNRYERSKALAEREALTFVDAGAPLVVVRPEFLYGPGDLHVLGLFRAVQRGRIFLIDGGRSYCHPTYIDDGVRGMLLALEKGEIGQIYHIAGDRSLPMREFLGEIARATGGRQPRLSLPRPLALAAAALLEAAGRLAGFTPPLTRSAVDFFSTSYRFSWRKAADRLGYAPQVEIAPGLARTVAWYRARDLLA